MYFIHHRKFLARILLSALLTVFLFHNDYLTVSATAEELAAESEARKLLPVQSDEIENWPTGPQTSAQAAILMEAIPALFYMPKIFMKNYIRQAPPKFSLLSSQWKTETWTIWFPLVMRLYSACP